MPSIDHRVRIFDTTLRDGEQSPGCSMTPDGKLAVARQLERLGVDVIEAGFPVASQDDFDAVACIAQEVRTPIIAALCRTNAADIETGAKAIQSAQHPRLHTFVATSDIHMRDKLRMQPDEVIQLIKTMVRQACVFVPDVEFSAEDASRSDPEFLKRAVLAAVDAGATTINLPDTVGYAQPDEYGAMIRSISELPECRDVVISAHCHDDLGLAVANSLAAVKSGARQVECTINGIGERAGNASLEEVVMNLRTRSGYFSAQTAIQTPELYRTSRLVSELTGSSVQRNKAIVGANAFAHEAGIHQHGILANRATYEIMSAADVGWSGIAMVIGKHSGRHAIQSILASSSIRLDELQLVELLAKVKDLASRQKDVGSEDVLAMAETMLQRERKVAFEITDFVAVTGDKVPATATLKLRIGSDERTASAHGIGVVDACFSALKSSLGTPARLTRYSLEAVTGGSNALASIRVELEDAQGRRHSARAVHEDVVVASLNALASGYNRVIVAGESRG